MIAFDLAHKVREQIASDIEVETINSTKLIVHMPFVYDDGDPCSIYVDRVGENRWLLTDDGDVVKKAYDAGTDLRKSLHLERFQTLIGFYGVADNNGRLNLEANDDALTDSIFTLTQTCLEASWLGKPRQSPRAEESKLFAHKLDRLVKKTVGENRISRNWVDKVYDPNGTHPIDYRIDSKRQLFLFGVPNQLACLKATVSCQHYKLRGADFLSVVVFDHEERMPKKTADQLREVADRAFPRVGERAAIAEYLEQISV